MAKANGSSCGGEDQRERNRRIGALWRCRECVPLADFGGFQAAGCVGKGLVAREIGRFGRSNPGVFHRNLYQGSYNLFLTIGKLLILNEMAPRHGFEPRFTDQRPLSYAKFGTAAYRGIIPLSSSMTILWFAGMFPKCCRGPVGHSTSTEDTVVSLPRPNVSGSSLCEQ